MYKTIFILSFLVCPLVAVAAEVRPTQDIVKSEVVEPGGKDTMSGYKLEDFANFAESWKMVTVRFREDSEEMRVTYANPLAAKTLEEFKSEDGKTIDFPDGSVFAKIGVKTDRDPLFASSIVPSGARRFQFMIRDKKKFAATDGWGYVLFDSLGKTYPGNEQANVQACHACHKVAASRDYVFSELAPFNSKKGVFNHTSFLDDKQITKSFQKMEKKRAPKVVAKYLSKSQDYLMTYEGVIRDASFQGTLDEIAPLLIKESVLTATPALFLARNEQEFTLVEVMKSAEKCPNSMKPYFVKVHQTLAVPKSRGAGTINYQVVQKTFCHSGR